MQLNPSEISAVIKSRHPEASADVRNQGTVISVTDGIVRINFGLSDVMRRRNARIPGNTFGLSR